MLASTQFRIPVDFGVIGPIGRAIFVILGGKDCCRVEWMDELMMENGEDGTWNKLSRVSDKDEC